METKTIPFETFDHNHQKVPAYLETKSSVPDEPIDKHISEIKEFLRAYNPVLSGTDSLKGMLFSDTPHKDLEFLIHPNGGQMVVERNPLADEGLLRQIEFIRGSQSYIEFQFKGIKYILGYEHK